MRDGIMEGQIDNSWNHSFGSWDIYDASGWDFTQTGLVNNPYLSEIRGLVLLNKWRSEGLSESEIQEKFIHDAILGSFASAPNVNQIIHKIRNEGLSYEDALMLASNALYGKIISEAMNGKVLPPKGNKDSENHNIKEESAGKGTNAGGGIKSSDSDPLPLGANLIDKNDSLAKAASWVKPKEGYFDVIIHGSSDSFSVFRDGKWINLDQRSLATFIKKNNYNGQPIRLISCNTGALPTSIAQDLSNKLGSRVIAPSDTIWIHPNGNMTIGNNPLSNTGKWNTFNPEGNIR